MSAIAGLASATPSLGGECDVQRMMQAMAHRTPDGVWSWSDELASLSYGDLATGGAPKRHLACEGDVAIVADARLDNRAELLQALKFDDDSKSDAALILAAYMKWREGCAQRLLGDFAFAIWDAAADALFCGRDHFGVKPFYYREQNDRFRFASEIRALIGSERPSIDEQYIADFLVSIPPDVQSTLYREILRLPPAHTLSWRAGVKKIEAYWRLSDSISVLGQSSDPAGQLRALLAECVRCRLRDATPVGAFLSGGLDSSSIVAIAAPVVKARGKGMLHTLSMTFDRTPELSERKHIDTMVRACESNPHFVPCDDVDAFATGRELLAEQEGPFIAPGLAMSRGLYLNAKRLGVRVILDGHGGDEVISHGLGRLKELAIKGRWKTLWREVAAESGIYGQSSWRIFGAYFIIIGPPRLLLRPALRFLRRVRRALSPRRPGSQRSALTRHLNTSFAERAGVLERHAAFGAKHSAFRTEREQHIVAVTSPLHPYALEILDKVAAAAGVEVRYPFWDKRLIEFCLSLPAECKLRGGWSRRVLRDAMEGILPDSIRWRRDKFDFAPLLIRSMRGPAAVEIEKLLSSQAASISAYLNVTFVKEAFSRLRDPGQTIDGVDAQTLWRSVMLAVWLDDPDNPDRSDGASSGPSIREDVHVSVE